MHNFSECDDSVTIRVASQSSSITSFVGGYLDSLREGFPFFFLFFFLFYRLELDVGDYVTYTISLAGLCQLALGRPAPSLPSDVIR